jgi:cobalt-zinc-cadmium efflux system outer membrane protein
VRRKVISFVSFIFFSSGGLHSLAQTQLSALGLSIDEAVRRALASRASLKAEAERIAAAEGLRKQAGAIPNPEFQFQNENLRPGQHYTRDVDTLALINQPLDVLGKRRARLAAAAGVVSRTSAEYQFARWQLVQRVKNAYWSARGAQQVREVLRATVENFQKIVDYNAAQVSAGAIAEQDLLRVRLEHERLRISADLAAIDANRARVDLLREMGQTDFPDIVLTESLTDAPPVAPIDIEQVLARRADIQAARAALEQARSNAHVQEIAARPDLNIIYGYKRTQLPDALTGVNTVLASVRITLPLTDRNQGNRAAAEAEVRQAQQQLAATEAGVRADLESAVQEYRLREAEYRTLLQPLREHAATIAQIAGAAYAEGGTELLRLLDAERARLEAELAWVQGTIDYRQSIVRLEAAGGLNP